MTATTTENPIPVQAREFHLGSNEEILGQQRGRVIRLSNPEIGIAYYVDVTDRPKPPTIADVPEEPVLIRDYWQRELEDPRNRNTWYGNNEVIATITDEFDPDHQLRIYVGPSMKSEGKSVNAALFEKSGFKIARFYVPFSFDSGSAAELLYKEFMNAIKETTSDSDWKKELDKMLLGNTLLLPQK